LEDLDAEVGGCTPALDLGGGDHPDVSVGGATGGVRYPHAPFARGANTYLPRGQMYIRSYLRKLFPAKSGTPAMAAVNAVLGFTVPWSKLRLKALCILLGFLRSAGSLIPPHFPPWTPEVHSKYPVHARMARETATPLEAAEVQRAMAAVSAQPDCVATWRERVQDAETNPLPRGRRVPTLMHVPTATSGDPRNVFRACLARLLPGNGKAGRDGIRRVRVRAARTRINALLKNKTMWARLSLNKCIVLLKMLQSWGQLPPMVPSFGTSIISVCHRACIDHFHHFRPLDTSLILKKADKLAEDPHAVAAWVEAFHGPLIVDASSNHTSENVYDFVQHEVIPHPNKE
jgi:hypothetical protein